MPGEAQAPRLAAVALCVALGLLLAPQGASAAPCAGGTTAWTGLGGDNDFANDANWDNGAPMTGCDGFIQDATAPVVLSAATASPRSLTIGGRGISQTLRITGAGGQQYLHASGSIEIDQDGALIMDCTGACATRNVVEADGGIANAGAIISRPGVLGGDPENDIRADLLNVGTIHVDKIAGGNPLLYRGGGPCCSAATLDNQGAIVLGSQCREACLEMTDGSTLENDAGGTVGNAASPDGFLRIDAGGRYVQAGGATSTGGALPPVMVAGGDLTLDGSGSPVEVGLIGGTPSNASGSLVGGEELRVFGGLAVSGGTLIDGGAIQTEGAGSPTLSGSIATVGGGVLDVRSDTSGGNLDATGGLVLVGPGATLTPGGGLLTSHGGEIGGEGTIDGAVDNVSGIVDPGTGTGIGRLTIAGSYRQGSGARLDIDAAGAGDSSHDKLVVGGDVALDGELRLIPEGGYDESAQPGDSLSALSYEGGRDGAFADSQAVPPLAGGGPVDVAYDDPGREVLAVLGPAAAPGAAAGQPGPAPLALSDPPDPLLEPSRSFTLVRKPVNLLDGRPGVEVVTRGSCRLTIVEASARRGGARGPTSRKGAGRRFGYFRRSSVDARGAGHHVVPIRLTARGRRALRRLERSRGGRRSSAAAGLRDRAAIACRPLEYPGLSLPDGVPAGGTIETAPPVPVGLPARRASVGVSIAPPVRAVRAADPLLFAAHGENPGCCGAAPGAEVSFSAADGKVFGLRVKAAAPCSTGAGGDAGAIDYSGALPQSVPLTNGAFDTGALPVGGVDAVRVSGSGDLTDGFEVLVTVSQPGGCYRLSSFFATSEAGPDGRGRQRE